MGEVEFMMHKLNRGLAQPVKTDNTSAFKKRQYFRR